MTGPADEVDRIVAAWRRERPDLDVSPLEVLSRVDRLSRHLDRARRAAFAAHGLESWAFDVLAALRDAGARLSRMSGSGATCFGVFADAAAAQAARDAIARARPGWWVAQTHTLPSPPPAR